MLESFFLCFLPLFVAIDVLGVVPFFLSLTEAYDARRRSRVARSATLTALAVSLVFLLAGALLFDFLRISQSDFRVGGGIVLLVLAVKDLIFARDDHRVASVSDPGVVPIGIPLIMGPAGLTTLLILKDAYGFGLTVAALVTNLAVVWLVFSQAQRIARLIGPGGSRAVAKVAALFLAGIAVMMIRSGIAEMIHTFRSQ